MEGEKNEVCRRVKRVKKFIIKTIKRSCLSGHTGENIENMICGGQKQFRTQEISQFCAFICLSIFLSILEELNCLLSP